MNYFHRYKRIFASDLIKVDKKNKNIKFNNDRANQLNKIEKVVNEKPIVVNVPKEKKRVTKKEIVQPRQQIRKSTSDSKTKKMMIIFMNSKKVLFC